MCTEKNWDVLLIGGASGSGKTSISRPLARHYGVDFVRVDDFQVMLDAITTPESHPAIHYWRTHPNWMEEGADATVRQLIDVGEMLIPGLISVINDHLDENIPMILEGDFILPQLSASIKHPGVKSVFIYEPDREQILQNYLAREGEHQPYRADVSHSYGNWLAENCANLGVMSIESRPWCNLIERVIKALSNH